MTIVRLLIDPQKLIASKSNFTIVKDIGDYAPVCVKIRQALRGSDKKPLEIHVLNATVGDWLISWCQEYGEKRVEIKVYTARDALSEKWGIEVPLIKDADIINAGLLSAKVTPREGQNFENALLENYFHQIFSYPVFPPELLPGFLNELDLPKWQKNSYIQLFKRMLRTRLDQWSQKTPKQAHKAIIRWIGRDPNELRQQFGWFKVLKDYPPSLSEKLLPENSELFQQAHIDTDLLSLDGVDLAPAITEIEYYLKSIEDKITSKDAFTPLLGSVSGYLLQEYTAIEKHLLRNPEWITNDLVRKVERRFLALRAGLQSRFVHLRRLVAVPQPPKPEDSWSVDDWLNWAAGDYARYIRWLELQGKYDDEVAQSASTFADWYYQSLIELKNQSAHQFSFAALYKDYLGIVNTNKIGLVVLLDNLNYIHFPELHRLLNQQDIALMSEHPVLSLPPTATEIGKPSIIAVTGDLTDIKSRDYSKMVSKYWEERLKSNNKSATYLSKIGELQTLTVIQHDIYFLNYLQVDTILHQSDKEIGQDHSTAIQNSFKILVDAIVEFARRFQIENQLVVYVVSDHGSTRIAKDVVNVLDKKYYKGIADIKHHRYLAISDQQLNELPQVVEAQCYVFDRKKYKTEYNYLAARKYYRFAETNEDYYVHGGLTPEEVVVPFARFEFQPLEIENPTITLMQDVFRFAVKSKVEIEVGNPNECTLENISIRLVGLEADEVFIDELQPKESKVITFPTVFRRELGRDKTGELNVRVQYECQEKMFEPLTKMFPVTMKSLMEVQDDFDL